MKLVLVMILAVLLGILTWTDSFGEKNTFFETVKFIQYLDENTALEEVRNENLDIYYFRIPSDRLEDQKSREGLQVFDSTTGSYSLLLNPAESEKFNPFSKKEIRFALNYLIDRKLIVNELMGGYGIPMFSYYSPTDPEYFSVIEDLERFNIRYNPNIAKEIISKSLQSSGAIKQDSVWYFNGEPIEITVFIRSDDPIRKSIGEILSSELNEIGFKTKKEFGDLNKAFVIVYGSNPAELKWHIYTEGWSKSAFVKYDAVGLGQMYSPWFANMPGFNVPSYWNYKNDYLDSITQKIYTGNFSSSEERNELVRNAVIEGINESVRIFLASKIDLYVANEKINGIVNDFGVGVPSRFTPINVKGDNEELAIGVKQIYQGSWNPIGGLSDIYSRHIWNVISDPATFKHPFTGETIPVRAEWHVNTTKSGSKLEVPQNAIIWEPKDQNWKEVERGTQSESKVTFDFKFSNWHNGNMMDMSDILYSLYFLIEWGTLSHENDKTFDVEFSPRAEQTAKTIVGVNLVDKDTLDVYVDYWHFDEREIAEWASLWSVVPWEISLAMEQAVLDGKMSFSKAGSMEKNVKWLSLIIPKDARIIQEYLREFKSEMHIPNALREFEENDKYYESRYDASIEWIEEKDHAVISNGPFVLKSYSPESRTITINSFNDEKYPFVLGHWSEFEEPKFPKITKVQMPTTIDIKSEKIVKIDTTNADSVIYFLTDNKGNNILSKTEKTNSNQIEIALTRDLLKNLNVGISSLKLFAISNTVLKPDYYVTSFMITEDEEDIDIEIAKTIPDKQWTNETLWSLVIISIVVIILLIVYKMRSGK